jgi:hypothetical protein
MVKNGSPVDVVSKAILQAVTSKYPSLRYLAGKDIENWAANKKTMSDKEYWTMRDKFLYVVIPGGRDTTTMSQDSHLKCMHYIKLKSCLF